MPATIVGPLSASLADVSVATNITAAQVLKAAPGVAATLVCVAPGSSGSVVLNDCTSVGGAGVTNEIYAALFSALSAGKTLKLNWPCASGITISAVPVGSQFSLAFM